ncbi:hypothetical protein BCR42DRAFT_422544 [Absidia repens]|uniref:CHCH domain-containing protein n=1 Tax=Absidia repens TaxID=90262 RepID=A0A1X2I6P4_9FUNG|nr:hypothetical protein BCR42DRAFT_422544 [Absidia repens]
MPRRSTQSRRSAPSHQQTRQAHTVPQRQAPPPQQQQHQTSPVAHQQQPRQPGLFGQMASTAAGVAVGSSVGHAIGSMFTGGQAQDTPPPMDQQQQQPVEQQQYAGQQQQQQQNAVAGNCEADAKAFTKCLEDNTNDISACQWYLDQLKSCRQMAQQY